MNDAKKGDIKTTIKPIIDFDGHIIEIEVRTEVNGIVQSYSREVMDVKEKIVRASLIALGWTPPVG